jgi:hypothetical protein
VAELTVKMIPDPEHGTEDEKYVIIPGGQDLENPPDWTGYLEYFVAEAHPYLEVLKQYVIDEGLVGTKGEYHNSNAFLFSDGTTYGFTWRAWGDFMQAVVGKREGYMAYYM